MVKNWLFSCSSTECSTALNICSNCLGERQCKSCITNYKPECSSCADDIYNKNDLETIDGNDYLMCDSSDPFHGKICHLFCRGQFYQTGQCVRLLNLPVCECSTNTQTQTTTSIPNTTTKPIEFEGSIKMVLNADALNMISLPNGDLASGSLGRIQIWDTDKGIVKKNLTNSLEHYQTVGFGFLSSGNLVSASFTVNNPYSGKMVIWNLTDFSSVKIFDISERSWHLFVLPNDDIVTGHDSNSTIIIRDSSTGLIKRKLIGHTNSVEKIIQFENGMLASGSYDKTIKIWDLSTGLVFRTINAHTAAVQYLSLLPNGNLLSVSSDQYIKIWNPITGNFITSMHANTPLCGSIILKNGNILTGGCTGIIQEWSLSNGLKQTLYSTSTMAIHFFTYLQNNYLVSSSITKELIIWS